MSSLEPTEVASAVTIQSLLEAGLHFGHQTKRWNPKMKRYIFDKRNGIHIIDLAKSLPMLEAARQFMYDIVASGKKVLFVGTKKQAQAAVKEVALRCGQPYVVTRWLGGCLTNSHTVRLSVKRYRMLQKMDTDGTFATLSKKEVSRLRNELLKLDRNLCGIADMADMPGCLFVVDVCRESIAVAEANALHIPVVAMLDTNCNPTPIDYPIPANDDAIRSIKLVVTAMAESVEKANREYSARAAEIARKREEDAAAAKAASAKAAADKVVAAEAAALREEILAKNAAKLKASAVPADDLDAAADDSDDAPEIVGHVEIKRIKSKVHKDGRKGSLETAEEELEHTKVKIPVPAARPSAPAKGKPVTVAPKQAAVTTPKTPEQETKNG